MIKETIAKPERLKFHYKTPERLRMDLDKYAPYLELVNKESAKRIFSEELEITGKIKSTNRIAIHPMEGCDGTNEGKPGRLALRRYGRFAESGAGIIWFEATAVVPEGRANPRQLLINEENKNDIARLVKIVDEKWRDPRDSGAHAVKILQLTHSGRYSKPERKYPLRLYKCAPLDEAYGLTGDMGEIVDDDYLDGLIDYYKEAATIAKEIGFDGVDIKACHRYLISESLGAFTRKDSEYGGESYESRTRLLKRIYGNLNTKLSSQNFLITLRLNIYDGIPHPFGWGVARNDKGIDEILHEMKDPLVMKPPAPDLNEPIKLLRELYEQGLRLVNITMGNPYYNPHISRPYDIPPIGANKSDKGNVGAVINPLKGVARFIALTADLKKALPADLKVIGTGYTWLRQFGPLIGAAEIQRGHVDIIGWGRMAFANPDFPRQIMAEGLIDPEKTCITCSNCTLLMRKGAFAGCPIRDKDVYGKILRDTVSKR